MQIFNIKYETFLTSSLSLFKTVTSQTRRAGNTALAVLIFTLFTALSCKILIFLLLYLANSERSQLRDVVNLENLVLSLRGIELNVIF